MSKQYEKIILCKGVSKENEMQKSYKTVLQNGGYLCDILPALNFEYVNLNELQNCLINYHQYSGFIFTSQRSIEAIDLIQKNELINFKNWELLPAYCVGPTTAFLAKKRLNLQNILGEESGNAENLANFIVQNSTTEMLPLLYPCSEIARETIDEILIKKKINFKKLVVYQTLPSKTLETDFKEIIKSSVNFLVFFSPSIVEYVIPLVKKHNHLLTNTKFIAIGQVTNDSLNKLGQKVSAISLKPEPLALLNAIKSCS